MSDAQKGEQRGRAMFGPGSRGHGMGIDKAKNVRGTLRRLLSYFRRYRTTLVFVFVLAAFGTAMALLGPYLMGVAIDKLVAREAASVLLRIVGLMVASYIVAWMAQTGQGVLIATIAQRAMRVLRGSPWSRA